MRELLLATRSAGKLAELGPMLQQLGFRVISLDQAGIVQQPAEDELEIFETFEENALAKARWFARLSGGRPVLADDSGLEVEALAGRPGVRSKRWSGGDALDGQALDDRNNQHLVHTLSESGAREPWAARYVCAAACVWPSGEVVAIGETCGRILRTPRGAGGFGYDPFFEAQPLGRTFAEISREEKAALSHRGRAVRELVRLLDTKQEWQAAFPRTSAAS